MPSDHSSPAADPRLAGLPATVVASVQSAASALAHGDTTSATALLDAALTRAPQHAELLRLRAYAALMQLDSARAVALYRQAAALRPDDAPIACELGVALARSGNFADAETAFRTAIALDGDMVDAWYNLGLVLDARAAPMDADDAFARVLAIAPDHQAARLQRARTLQALGRSAQADAELRQALERDRAWVPAWVALSLSASFQPEASDLDEVMNLHESGKVAHAMRIPLAFASAALFEKAGRYEEAYTQFSEANAAKHEALRWNAGAVSHLVDEILDGFAHLPEPVRSDRGKGAIFLVGMPLAGADNVERILSARADVQRAGETHLVTEVLREESRRRGAQFPQWVELADAADWTRLGDAYLARVATWRDARPFFVDATVANWQVLGAIRHMLPAARVVYVHRNPLDLLWSCYRHDFAEGHAFSYDIGDLVAYWRDCEHALHAWNERYPDLIHVFDSDRLIDERAAQLRLLQERCGLQPQAESEDAMIQPLRPLASAGEQYGSFLDPFRRAMAGQNA